jgi:hypothetical protein
MKKIKPSEMKTGKVYRLKIPRTTHRTFGTIRAGRLDPRTLHVSDIRKICEPRGQYAQDSVDRDFDMDSGDDSW